MCFNGRRCSLVDITDRKNNTNKQAVIRGVYGDPMGMGVSFGLLYGMGMGITSWEWEWHMCKRSPRAGVRHVRGVRPNRAADFRGPPILASFI